MASKEKQPIQNLALLSFRDYLPADIDSCTAVFDSNRPQFFLDHELELFQEFLGRQECPYFVVLLGNNIVGCGGYGMGEDTSCADLCWGMVDSQWHGKNVGAYLLFLRLFKIVFDTDATHVRLDTSQHTFGFFEKFGFATQWKKSEGYGKDLDKYEMLIELNEKNGQLIEANWLQLSQ